ncbi:MAG: site-specific integrase [Pseudomonadota bacterium]
MPTNLTLARIRNFSCPADKKQAFLWDAMVPGLGLRATKAGAKSYVFQARLHGKTIRRTIGNAAGWNLEDARKEAKRLRVLADKGVDPQQERREQQQAAQEAERKQEQGKVTLGAVWPEYIEARCNDWSASHLHDHYTIMQKPGLPRKRSSQKTIAGPLFALHGVRLVDFTPERLAEWMKTERKKRPAAAARAYRLLRACLSWCVEQQRYQGMIDPPTLLNSSVRRLVPSVQSKTDALQKDMLAPWFKAVRSLSNPVFAAFLQALLLIGARRGELATLTWDNTDFQWRTMTIHDKVEDERTIPLTPFVANLLYRLPRRNQWVFSSPRSESGRLMEPTRAHKRALEAAGLPEMTIHGLRRSFGTLAEWIECPVGVVAQIQGHKPSALAEKHYRRRPIDLLRMWHTKIEAWVLEQAGLEQPKEENIKVMKVVKL